MLKRTTTTILVSFFLLFLIAPFAFAAQNRVLEQPMTDFAVPTPYVVSSSFSEQAGLESWNAFDYMVGDGNSGTGDAQADADVYNLDLDLGAANASTKINGYNITATGYNGTRNLDPFDWEIHGSTDGFVVSDDTLTTQSNQTFASGGATKSYTFSNAVGYRYYRFRQTSSRGNVGVSLLGELRYTISPQVAAAQPPLINFTATNISSGAPITSFCINGVGTNTTFNSCTTNGTVYNNLSGTYNYTAFNATGFQNQTVLNYNFNTNKSIQFNLTPTNIAPIINAVTMTVTSNNQTLIASANASDPNNNNVSYLWRLYRNNTFLTSGTSSTYTPNTLRNFANFSTGSMDGTYIVEVRANDGSLNSSPTNSSPVTVTFPGVLNTAPTLVTVTLSKTANNQTLISSANATDAQNNSITYFWRLFRNNTLIQSGSNTGFTAGLLRNFHNFSTSSVDGTYIVEAMANDGFLNSSRINSSPVTVTFPSAGPAPPIDNSDVTHATSMVIILFIILFLYFSFLSARIQERSIDYAVVAIAVIIFLVATLPLLF